VRSPSPKGLEIVDWVSNIDNLSPEIVPKYSEGQLGKEKKQNLHLSPFIHSMNVSGLHSPVLVYGV